MGMKEQDMEFIPITEVPKGKNILRGKFGVKTRRYKGQDLWAAGHLES